MDQTYGMNKWMKLAQRSIKFNAIDMRRRSPCWHDPLSFLLFLSSHGNKNKNYLLFSQGSMFARYQPRQRSSATSWLTLYLRTILNPSLNGLDWAPVGHMLGRSINRMAVTPLYKVKRLNLSSIFEIVKSRIDCFGFGGTKSCHEWALVSS